MKDNMSPEMKEALKAKIAEQGGGKITLSDLSFTRDTALFKVNGMQIGLGVVDREEPMKCVKFQADQSPVDVTLAASPSMSISPSSSSRWLARSSMASPTSLPRCSPRFPINLSFE